MVHREKLRVKGSGILAWRETTHLGEGHVEGFSTLKPAGVRKIMELY
jgi:hypothetical protein